jgi:hypothetical protein
MSFCTMSSLFRRAPTSRWPGALLVAVSAWLAPSAHAAVAGGGSLGTDNPEFLLILTDAASQTTYALDLGIDVTTLRTDGQSDEGFQRFWTLDPALDSKLASFLGASGSVSAMRWQVGATDQVNDAFEQFGFWLYTTLEHTAPTGTLDLTYQNFVAFDREAFETALNGQGSYVDGINTQGCGGNNGMCSLGQTPDPALNGSLFAATPDESGSAFASSQNVLQLGIVGAPSPSNLVGRSSWAYMAVSDFYGGSSDPMVLDEFDNLEHDAYWGLAQDPDTGILYLSYTLDAVGLSAAQREFALGIGRTEFGGGFAVRRLDGVAVAAGVELPSGVSRVLGAAVVTSPVPEPGTWGLMALGLFGLGAHAARARRQR